MCFCYNIFKDNKKMCNKSKVKGDTFEYNILFKTFESKNIQTVINSLQPSFADIAKNLDVNSNTQWIIRTYLASKMILASSVMLTSAEYAECKNLRIVMPYLMYYSLLSCARAVVFTNPRYEWKEELVTMNHSKTINIVGDIVSRYDKEEGKSIELFIDKSRIYREIFSYKFPAEGLRGMNLNFEKVVEICSLLAEIAQLQSAILESAITKHCKEKYDIDEVEFRKLYLYDGKGFKFFDSEDGYRLDYIKRKVSRPYSIINTMTEGMVDDFFGSWCGDDEDENYEDLYNPDQNWRIIFPVP